MEGDDVGSRWIAEEIGEMDGRRKERAQGRMRRRRRVRLGEAIFQEFCMRRGKIKVQWKLTGFRFSINFC